MVQLSISFLDLTRQDNILPYSPSKSLHHFDTAKSHASMGDTCACGFDVIDFLLSTDCASAPLSSTPPERLTDGLGNRGRLWNTVYDEFSSIRLDLALNDPVDCGNRKKPHPRTFTRFGICGGNLIHEKDLRNLSITFVGILCNVV
jgi:hypothetical protein